MKFILVLMFLSVFACDNSIISEDGKLISNTVCKNEKNVLFDKSETCVEYSYNKETKTLNLKHINAGFNCCPKALYAEIVKEGNIITIEESERTQECNCMCLYDMEIEVYNVESQVYSIKFKEPYIGDQYELFFEINLLKEQSGTYCLTREQDPWGY